MLSQHPRTYLASLLAGGLLAATVMTRPATAGFITDPANDFISTFAGAHDPSLDVLSLSATFDGTTFHVSATEAGNIAAFPTGLFVIGFNRGAANNNFSAIGLPGVVFDAVITLTSSAVTGGRDLVANAPIVLAPGSATINGAVFQIDIPLTALPSQGLLPGQYGVNLWPRDSSVVAGNTQISDFAPNATDLVVPEPMSAAILATALLGLGVSRRRRAG